MTLNKTSQFALRKLAYKLGLQVRDKHMKFEASNRSISVHVGESEMKRELKNTDYVYRIKCKNCGLWYDTTMPIVLIRATECDRCGQQQMHRVIENDSS